MSNDWGMYPVLSLLKSHILFIYYIPSGHSKFFEKALKNVRLIRRSSKKRIGQTSLDVDLVPPYSNKDLEKID